MNSYGDPRKRAAESAAAARKQSADQGASRGMQRGVSPGRRQPGEQVYRFTDRTIRVWTTVLSLSIPALLVIGGLVAFISWLIEKSDPAIDAGSSPGFIAGAVIMASGIVLPLLAAAVLGGESLHLGGGVIGFLFAAGILGSAVGDSFDIPWLKTGGIVAIVVGGLGFFLLGHIRGVPMWIGGGTVGSPRTGISDGTLPGESAPGVLGPKQSRPDPSRPE